VVIEPHRYSNTLKAPPARTEQPVGHLIYVCSVLDSATTWLRTGVSPLNRARVITPEWMEGSVMINEALSLTPNGFMVLLVFALVVFAGDALICAKPPRAGSSGGYPKPGHVVARLWYKKGPTSHRAVDPILTTLPPGSGRLIPHPLPAAACGVWGVVCGVLVLCLAWACFQPRIDQRRP